MGESDVGPCRSGVNPAEVGKGDSVAVVVLSAFVEPLSVVDNSPSRCVLSVVVSPAGFVMASVVNSVVVCVEVVVTCVVICSGSSPVAEYDSVREVSPLHQIVCSCATTPLCHRLPSQVKLHSSDKFSKTESDLENGAYVKAMSPMLSLGGFQVRTMLVFSSVFA